MFHPFLALSSLVVSLLTTRTFSFITITLTSPRVAVFSTQLHSPDWVGRGEALVPSLQIVSSSVSKILKHSIQEFIL